MSSFFGSYYTRPAVVLTAEEVQDDVPGPQSRSQLVTPREIGNLLPTGHGPIVHHAVWSCPGAASQSLRGHVLALVRPHMENIMRKIAALFTGTVATVVLLIAPVTSASASPSHGSSANVSCTGCWPSAK